MTSRIEIVPYDDRWPGEFLQIGRAIREAMGDRALRIDHIGSTSVPGLVAKDVVDVQVTVRHLDAASIAAALAPAGYAPWNDIAFDHVPLGWEGGIDDDWQKLYFRAPDGQRPTHLHVRQAGRANQRYALLFRDYLRASPQAAGAYGLVKMALARLHPDDEDAYYDVKDPVCDIVMDAAERWAEATGYAPGPSDV
jgi:GrpB-like predicted nucleotidyltransferase (UPF0157 family)